MTQKITKQTLQLLKGGIYQGQIYNLVIAPKGNSHGTGYEGGSSDFSHLIKTAMFYLTIGDQNTYSYNLEYEPAVYPLLKDDELDTLVQLVFSHNVRQHFKVALGSSSEEITQQLVEGSAATPIADLDKIKRMY